MIDPLTQNPFAVLTAVVAPAVLTNASTVLCLGTSNRIARVVDRTRFLAGEMAALDLDCPDYQAHAKQLERLQLRGQMLMKALRMLYGTVGAFAASALVSVLGSALAFYELHYAFRLVAAVALIIGISAVTGLVSGCLLMVREARLALEHLAEEAELARIHRTPPPARGPAGEPGVF